MKNETSYTLNTLKQIQAFEAPMAKVAADAVVFTSQKELASLVARWPMADLVETWNVNQAAALGAGAMPMRRFQDRNVAVRRLFTLAGQLPLVPAEQTKADLAAAEAEPLARAGSKKADVLVLLGRKEGATGAEIMAATGWQAHTVRGFIAGTVRAKMKLNVVATREDTGTRYHLEA